MQDGELQTVPLINEMDWFNSAMVVYQAWKSQNSTNLQNLVGLSGRKWEEATGFNTSRGLQTAKLLLPHIAASHVDLHRNGVPAAEGVCPTAEGLAQGLKVSDNRTVVVSQQQQAAHLGEVYLSS